jgi:hypothetical protein
VIVISSILALIAANPALSGMRAVRSLRALRPLRMISRNPGMQCVVNSLFKSIPGIASVSVIILLFYLIFAIVFVNLYKGCFGECMGPGFDALTPDQKALVVSPLPYHLLLAQNATLAEAWAGVVSNATAPEGGYVGATSKSVCNWLGAEWQAHGSQGGIEQHFDNVPAAILVLFEVGTTEGWVKIMQATVDATGPDMQPIVNHNVGAAYLMVAFVIFSSIFLLNLFVGVVISNFQKLKKENNGVSLLITSNQMQWIQANKLIASFQPRFYYKPKLSEMCGLRAWCWELASNPEDFPHSDGAVLKGKRNDIFEVHTLLPHIPHTCCTSVFYSPIPTHKFNMHPPRPHVSALALSPQTLVMFAIVANTGCMMSCYYGMSDELRDGLHKANLAFFCVYVCEAAVKMLGLGLSAYFTVNWNRFDLLLIFGSAGGMLVEALGGGGVGGAAAAVRTLRVGRAIRLVKKAKGLQKLFATLIGAFPAMANVASLLFLFYLIFAALGVQLFAAVSPQYPSPGALNERTNFQNFGNAMLTLIVCSTGEAWNELMYDIARKEPNCVPYPEFDPRVCGYEGSDLDTCIPMKGCGSYASYPFFVLFVVLVTFIFLQLFIGAIFEGFDLAQEQARQDEMDKQGIPDSHLTGLTRREYVCFCDAWRHLDPQMTKLVGEDQVLKLIARLPQVRMIPPPCLFFSFSCARLFRQADPSLSLTHTTANGVSTT